MALLGFPLTQQQTVSDPQQPFIWGSGGRRLTPEDIALQRQVAEQQRMAGADFSPVGSVWEGLGRVVSGLSSSYSREQARREAERNAAESQSIAELLMGQGDGAPDNNAVLQALVNPYVSDEVRGLANMQWQRMNAAAEALSPLGKIAADEGYRPGTPEFYQRVADLGNIDRMKHIPIEAGGSLLEYDPVSGGVRYAVAPADLAGRLNSQQPSSDIPPDAIEALRRGEGTPAQFDEMFGPGSAARVMGMGGIPAPELDASGNPASLTAAQYQAIANALGVDEAADYVARNGIMVGR